LIVVLALLAVAAAQVLYTGGYSAPSLHNAYAASSSTGIRRFGSTGGYLAPGYVVAAPAYVY